MANYEITPEEKRLLKLLERRNITPQAAKDLISHAGKRKSFKQTKHVPLRGDTVRYTSLGDTHMGHKNYRGDVWNDALQRSADFGSDFIVHAGDVTEGMSGREGHIYELDRLGVSEQTDFAVEEWNKSELPIYFITATNSHDGWSNNKGNQGYDLGPDLARRVELADFCGHDEADLELDNGLVIRLMHPGDGTAYAVSYKGQKYLNACPPEDRPDIIHCGHYHKSLHMFYQGVHYFENGCLEDQTIFMKKKQTPAFVGYWLVEATPKKGDFPDVKAEFVPFKERRE